MTIRHLNVFIEVVDAGGIGKASERLYISQPAVSQTIAEIENFYGIKLFERLNRKLFITSDGEKLLEYARHICSSFNEMELNLGKMKNYGRLNIGATITIGTCLLPKIIKEYADDNIEVIVDNTAEIEKLILLNKIDIGLIEGAVTSEDIVTIPFYNDEMIFVSKNGVYNKSAYILREEGSGTRELALKELKLMQITPKNIWSMRNTEAIKNAVKLGLGVTAMSRLLLETELKSGELIQIEPKHVMTRQFVIAYHKNKFQNAKFLKFLSGTKCST